MIYGCFFKGGFSLPIKCELFFYAVKFQRDKFLDETESAV